VNKGDLAIIYNIYREFDGLDMDLHGLWGSEYQTYANISDK
jgi:hypothetical protein